MREGGCQVKCLLSGCGNTSLGNMYDEGCGGRDSAVKLTLHEVSARSVQQVGLNATIAANGQ